MSKLVLKDSVVFRVPRFSYLEELADNWNELKEMIGYSSTDFYQLIKNMSYVELAHADKKIQMTVRKYFNRARFRSTPYGYFSTVGFGTFTRETNTLVEFDEKIIAHSFVDWTATQLLQKEQFNTGLLFFANTTFYRVQHEIRFLQRNEQDFQTAAIDHDELIWELLEFCNPPKKIDQIFSRFQHLDHEALTALMADLVSIQLLLTSNLTNIIGKDYFKRIDAEAYQTRKKKYLISERKIKEGAFDKTVFRHLPDLILSLQKISNANQSSDLRTFRNNFIRRYEQAEVPLLEAIDPEAGIGYGNFTSQVNGSEITRLAGIPPKEDNNDNEDFRKQLYAQILDAVETGKAIELEKLLEDNKKGNPLPNSLSAICTAFDDTVWLDFIGGASATSISGRFALAIPEIDTFCKDIAAWEQKANPEVLFFDIGYTKEINVDNINRRPAIYEKQLNILNYDTSAQPLSVNDILISIQEGHVVLRSKSLGKRLIPRMSTAYNHLRSDLSVLRLLLDIQYQGITTDLVPRITNMAPGLSYYPRIQFRNIIVSPATWKINDKIIKGVNSKNEQHSVLKTYLNEVITCNYLKVGHADQTLLLDVNSDADLVLLVDMLQKRKELFAEEAILPVSPVAIDHYHKPMLPQLVLTLYHPEQVYKPMRHPATEMATMDRNSWVAPGNEWLYFEIYISPYQSDLLLNQRISSFLQHNRHLLNSWFFIRYSEDGDHIRLRLKLSKKQYGYQLINRLSEALTDELKSGIVSDIKLRVYRKEAHRYSPRLINQVEDHFCKDSKFVLSMLTAMLPDMAKYKLCVAVMEAVAYSEIIPIEEYLTIARQIENHLSAEYNLSTDDYKEINKMYRTYLKQESPSLSRRARIQHQTMIASFIDTIRKYEKSKRAQIFADLIHMHINRVFAKDQRLHELIVYNFYLTSEKASRHKQHIKASAG